MALDQYTVKILKIDSLPDLIGLSESLFTESGFTDCIPNIRRQLASYFFHSSVIAIYHEDKAVGMFVGEVNLVPFLGHKVMFEHVLHVEQAHRGKGAAKLLILAAKALAKKEGCKKIICAPSLFGSKEPERARKFLEKNGFKLFGYGMLEDI